MNRIETKSRPIVIYRIGSLGDMIVALPSLHLVASAFPHSRRLLLTNAPVSAKAASVDTILGNSGLIDEIIEYPLRLRSPSQLLGLAKAIRATGARDLVYMAPNRGAIRLYRDIAFFTTCGIRRFHGLPLRRDLREGLLVDGVQERECMRLARTLVGLGRVDFEDFANWSLHLTQLEHSRAVEVLGPLAAAPFIAINMGGKEPSNDWGQERWAALMRDLATHFRGYGLVIIGAAVDRERAGQVAAHWAGTVADLCGAVTVRECAAVLSRAAMFIGHDSGPLHLAASVGTASVGLFGNFNRPAKWHPLGKEHRIIHNMQGVGAITIAEVASAARAVLDRCPADRAKRGRHGRD